jgi:hypothetical protein
MRFGSICILAPHHHAFRIAGYAADEAKEKKSVQNSSKLEYSFILSAQFFSMLSGHRFCWKVHLIHSRQSQHQHSNKTTPVQAKRAPARPKQTRQKPILPHFQYQIHLLAHI